MAGIAGIVLVQRHLVPPRAEELGRMAASLGGAGETLIAGGSGTAVVGSPVHRLERGGWRVAAGGDSAPAPDGEALLAADPGPALAHRTGPFALALWDGAGGRLILAADRQGQVPLYYTLARGRVCFGSRVAALREGLGGELEMDAVGLDQLFTLGAPVAPRTVFEGIERVPPGHWVEFGAGHIAIHRFAPPAFAPGGSVPEADPEDSLEEALEQVFKGTSATRMVVDPEDAADHPAAAMLLAAAGRRGLVSEEAAVAPPQGRAWPEETAQELETAVQALESPLVSLAPVGEAALLNGLRPSLAGRVATTAGGGLVSGQCQLVRELAIRRGWARQPDSVSRPRLLDALDPGRLTGARPVWRRSLYGMGLTTADAVTFSHLPRWDQRRRIRALYLDPVREAVPDDPVAELEEMLPPELIHWPGLHRALHLEFSLWLGGRRPGAVLAAAGIEVEHPWLDPAVMVAATTRPAAQVLRRAPRVRQSMSGWDTGAFFASGAVSAAGTDSSLGAYLDAHLDPDRVAATGLFDPERVGRLRARWRQGYRLTSGDRAALLAVVSTGIWTQYCLISPGRAAREVMA